MLLLRLMSRHCFIRQLTVNSISKYWNKEGVAVVVVVCNLCHQKALHLHQTTAAFVTPDILARYFGDPLTLLALLWFMTKYLQNE